MPSRAQIAAKIRLAISSCLPGIGPLLGGWAEDVGAPCLQFPLAGFRDCLGFGPMENSASAQSKKPGQLSVRLEAEQSLYGGL